MPVQRHLALRHRQRFTHGDPQLPFHQVEASDHLRYRMLHLQPRIHLHEVEVASWRDDELDSTGADIAHGLGCTRGCVTHGLTPFGCHAGGGCLFQHLLMTALHRAIAFVQMQAMALLVGEYLDFDMPRALKIFLDQHLVVAEAGNGLALARGQRRGEFFRMRNHAHAFAATTGTGLQQHGVANAIRCPLQSDQGLVGPVIARHHRHTGGFH